MGGGVGSGVGGQEGGGVGLVGGGVFRVDVNALLGVGGDVGYRGCEPRIKGNVQCTLRYCTILRKLKKCGGGGGVGGGAIFEPKTQSMYLKKRTKKKNVTEPGYIIRTHDLRVRKTFRVSYPLG